MSTTTTNLQLTIPDNADNTTRSNLEKIDAAFNQFTTGSDGTVYINASHDLVLQPDATSAGGSGEVNIGSSANPAALCRLYGPFRADSFRYNSSNPSIYTVVQGATAAAEIVTYFWPAAKATRAGQQFLVSSTATTSQTLEFKSIGQTRPINVETGTSLAMTSASGRCYRFTNVAGCNVTLPQASAVQDDEFIFIGQCVLDGYSTETIDGASTLSVAAGSRAIIKSDGSNWWRIA